MTISHNGAVATDCDTAADFTNNNGGANISTDDTNVQGTGAVGDKMSATNELLVSDNLSGGATGVYDFSSGGANEGEHIIGYMNVKNAINAGTGLQFMVRNASGHEGSWYLDDTGYTGGFKLFVVSPERDFNTATTWTTTGNPAQLDDVSEVGGEFDIAGSIMGSFNNSQVDQFSIGFGLRAASNRFTFDTTSGVSSANDTITATSHGWVDGTPLYYDKEGGSVDIGLTDLTTYYANIDGVNTVTMHATRAAALAGTGTVNLTATGSETHSIIPAYAFEDLTVFDEDDATNGKFGWWTRLQGGFLARGKISLGPATGNAESRWSDTDFAVTFADELVATGFYDIEMRGTDTYVEFTRGLISAANNAAETRWNLTCESGFGTTAGFGFNDTNSIYKGAGTITLRADCTMTGTSFIDCSLITQNGATLNGCSILDADTADGEHAILADDPGLIDNCSFTFSDGHAIRCDTTGTYSMTGNTFTGYGAAETNDAAFYNNSGGLITLNIGANDTAPTIRNGASATTTIVATVDVDVHVKDAAGNDIQGAQVSIHRDPPTAETSGAGNTAQDPDLVITGTIPADQPGSGYLSVFDVSLNETLGYRYSTHDSTSTFTFPTEVTFACTGGGDGTSLQDTVNDFTAINIEEGDAIRNDTDGSWAMVDTITDANNIITSPLQGGSDNTWTSGDFYSVHQLATTLVSGTDTVDMLLLNGQTDANGDAPTLSYDKTQAPTAVRVRIRSSSGGTKYVPFVTTASISATTGLTLDITMTEDTVAT